MTRTRKKLPPGGHIRVLIVDDSVMARRLLAQVLADDPLVEVVGHAANGAIALKMIPLVKPDVVTLDIEMPEMDGLETLREIRKLYPGLVVIMFSGMSERGAAITLEALTLGANDYLAKPTHAGSLTESVSRLRAELIPKFKHLFELSPEPHPRQAFQPAGGQPPASRFPPPLRPPQPKTPCQAIAIGVSTGGPNALAELVPMLPADLRPPVFIVQHMPPIFTRLLAERLQTLTKLCVREAADGMPVAARSVYLAPGDYHMRVVRTGSGIFVKIDQAEPENSCRPAVDVLFRSVAEVYGAGALGVILTGMGHDGLLGIECLRSAGSYIVAQDEASSVVWGMPGAVVNAGLADSVVDLRNVVPEIQKHL